MNATTDTNEPGYADDDRLPWLESADEDYRDGPSAARVVGLILLGLALVTAAIWGVSAWRSGHGVVGSGELINAQEGDYKIKPDEPGGMKVEGEGDTVFSTSEGGKSEGTINTRAVPEAPVKGRPAKAAKAGPGSATVVTTVPAAGGRLTATAPGVPAPKVAAGGGGSALVQLGSFPSEAAANAAWEASSRRFGYISALGKSVEKAEVGGRTVYRLRVNAGSSGNANAICGKLKVAGEACFVPN